MLPFSICFGQIVGTDDVGARVASLLGGLAGGEHRDADVLAGARRQGDGAADHLVGLAWVDAEADGDVDALVERRLRIRLGQRPAPRSA